MAQNRPKAIYIGVPQVGDAIAKMRPQWDFLDHVPNIQEFWSGLVDGTIENDIQIILVLDQFFDKNGDDSAFEKLVVTMAPHCMLGIINYHPNLREQIGEKIQFEAYNSGDDSSPMLYYFIDVKKTNESLDFATNHYINNAEDSYAADLIAGRSTEDSRQAYADDEGEVQHRTGFQPKEEEAPNPYLGQVVAITSSKGGSGKSTVAVSTATYLAHASYNSVKEGLAERPLKIIIVDCDVRDGQLGTLTGNTKPTVINIRLHGISKQIIEETAIHCPRLKVDVLLAPKRPRSADDTPPEFYAELIHNLRQMYDYVFLDTSVNYLDPLLEKVAYPTSDQIVFVTDIVINSVFSMMRWIKEVTTPRNQGGMGINKNKIGIVVNKSLPNVNMPGNKIKRAALGIPVITAIPSNPKLVAHAANMQSMEVLLRHPDLYPMIRRIAKGIVGNKYPLSDNVSA